MPAALFGFEEAFEGSVGLVGDEEVGKEDKGQQPRPISTDASFQEEAGQVHEDEGEGVGEDEGPSPQGRPVGEGVVEEEFSEEPAGGTDHEEEGLEVVGGVVEELQFFSEGEVRGGYGRPEELFDVEGMAFSPAHALFDELFEGSDAFSGGLDEGGVEDFVAIQVEAEGKFPVFGDGGTPAVFAEYIGSDHEDRAGDHLEGAEELLAGSFYDVGARELGTDAFGDPVFGGIEDVPLVALDGGESIVNEFRFRGEVPVMVVDAVEVGEELLEDIGWGDEVGIEDGDEGSVGASFGEGMFEGAALETLSILSMGDGDFGVGGPASF